MNDTLRTNVFVRFQPETIACACIYLAARALQVSIFISSLLIAFVYFQFFILILRIIMGINRLKSNPKGVGIPYK